MDVYDYLNDIEVNGERYPISLIDDLLDKGFLSVGQVVPIYLSGQFFANGKISEDGNLVIENQNVYLPKKGLDTIFTHSRLKMFNVNFHYSVYHAPFV